MKRRKLTKFSAYIFKIYPIGKLFHFYIDSTRARIGSVIQNTNFN